MPRSLLTILFVALIAARVLADGDGGDGGKEDHDHALEFASREVQIERKGSNEVEMQSEQKNPAAKTKDKFKLNVKLDGAMCEVRLEQYSRVDDTASGFKFRIRFFALLEYVEQDNVPGWTGGDLKCSRYRIRGDQMSVGNLVTTTVNGTAVTTFDVTTTSGSGGNVFALKFYVAGTAGSASEGRKFTIKSRDITPTTVKFDVDINNYFGGTYNNGTVACANSRLALLAKVKSAQSSRSATGVDKAIHMGSSATPLGFFTWADTVAITGGSSSSPAAVIIAPLLTESIATAGDGNNEGSGELDGGEGVQRAVYSFDAVHPTTIAWDPELGYAPPSSGVAHVTASLAVVLFAVLIAFSSSF